MGSMNVSQKDTSIWIAKTQGRGRDAPKTRSLYISRAAAHFLFFKEWPGASRKAKAILVGAA